MQLVKDSDPLLIEDHQIFDLVGDLNPQNCHPVLENGGSLSSEF